MRLSLGHGTLDLDRRTFIGPGGEARLTSIEARLLSHLASKPGQAFDRDQLQVEV
jgi:DNA-binding response OmpR family regulator